MVPKVIPLTDTHPQPQESKEICVSHPLLSSHSLSLIPSASFIQAAQPGSGAEISLSLSLSPQGVCNS